MAFRRRATPAAEAPGEPPAATSDDEMASPAEALAFVALAADAVGGAGRSYDDLIERGLSEILEKIFRVLKVFDVDPAVTGGVARFELAINFGAAHVGTPSYPVYDDPRAAFAPLMPTWALVSGHPYSAPVTCDATVRVTAHYADGRRSERAATVPRFELGSIPVLTGTSRCHTTRLPPATLRELGEEPSGGAFPIGGTEHTLPKTENIVYNSINVYAAPDRGLAARAEVISQRGGPFDNSTMVQVTLTAAGAIYAAITSTRWPNVRIPLYLLQRLLGAGTDRDAAALITLGAPALAARAHAAFLVREKVPDFEAVRRSYDLAAIAAAVAGRLAAHGGQAYEPAALLATLDGFLLPHLGATAAERGAKARYLGLMAHKALLVAAGALPPTDRDRISAKRFHDTGVILAKLFKTHVNAKVVAPIKAGLIAELSRRPYAPDALRAVVASVFERRVASDALNAALSKAITAGQKSAAGTARRAEGQVLERKNPTHVAATRRLIVAAASTQHKASKRARDMRMPHPSFAGYICPVHSADTGENVGTRKLPAVTADLTPGLDDAPLLALVLADPSIDVFPDVRREARCRDAAGASGAAPPGLGLGSSLRPEPSPSAGDSPSPPADATPPGSPPGLAEFVAPAAAPAPGREGDGSGRSPDPSPSEGTGRAAARARVFVSGIWIGHTANAYETAARYRELRRAGAFDRLISIHVDPVTAELNFWADVGRLYRPLLRTFGEPGALRHGFTRRLARRALAGELTLAGLVEAGVAELICADEQENCLIAPGAEALGDRRAYTHCEVPQAVVGISAINACFPNFTQPARWTYNTNQARNSGSWYAENFWARADKGRFLQAWIQTPLVATLANLWLPPNGTNAVVAYAVFGGGNQEDSAIVARSALERGLMAGAYFRTEVADRAPNETFAFPNPATTARLREPAAYAKLGPDGVVAVGAVVGPGDALVGRVAAAARAEPGEPPHVDASIYYSALTPAYVWDVVRTHGRNDEARVVVKLRSWRPFVIGDKGSSRAGNKFIGAVVLDDADMPYDADGCRPDVIINPQSFPTRQILGQIFEAAQAQLCARRGSLHDGTAWLPFDPADLAAAMAAAGLRANGRRTYFQAGRPFDAAVFVGPTFTQRIQKFVADDRQSVGVRGPSDPLTGQPTAGRDSAGKPLRVGEMEGWCFGVHGAIRNYLEKTLGHSDGRAVAICRTCGGVAARSADTYLCHTCGGRANIETTVGSKTGLLVTSLLRAANVVPTLALNPLEVLP